MKDHRSKENCPSWQPAPRFAAEQHQLQAHAAPASSSALGPFHFGAKRVQIDWRLLHGIDVNRMVRSPCKLARPALTEALVMPQSQAAQHVTVSLPAHTQMHSLTYDPNSACILLLL